MGNICRSPLAEAAFRAEAERLGLDVEVEFGRHRRLACGRAAGPRARSPRRGGGGVDIAHLRARKVSRADFDRFDHIVALDEENLADLAALRPPGSRAQRVAAARPCAGAGRAGGRRSLLWRRRPFRRDLARRHRRRRAALAAALQKEEAS